MSRTRRIATAAGVGAFVISALVGSAEAVLRLSGNGVVVGGLKPCYGLPVSNGPRYAAGTVTVLQGHVAWGVSGTTQQVATLPHTAVARDELGPNGIYLFLLSAGDYVLAGQYRGDSTSATPWVETSVSPGSIDHVDVPNMCI